MFKKVLIANRGEIVSRIIRTCKKMGIQTVVVYSEADVRAPFVKQADEAYSIGGSHIKDSYLDIDKIIEVAKRANVDAIHPGYGLLSENPQFATRCEQEGIVFIGPTSAVIARMGDKIEARISMEKANVPIIPGLNQSLHDLDEAVTFAREIGYPIMLKAASGGGGVGLQVVHNEGELRRAFEMIKMAALRFFGDGTIYIVKFIENPRHIEVQIMADQFGTCVHLWERDCSIQRRHQKIIEEAPSPFLDEDTRLAMCEVAVNAARTLGYTNVGTVEFLVDEQKNFYFLEMNPRLQVEHPITEAITGIDLVEQQIRIASGQALSFSQQDIHRNGHAIEARIYAEDPVTFYPSPGKITDLCLPLEEGIRHELAVDKDYIVTPFYDPMIAKLIVWGNHREAAIQKMHDALNRYVVEGIKTNIPLLRQIVNHHSFKKGYSTTNFINRYIF